VFSIIARALYNTNPQFPEEVAKIDDESDLGVKKCSSNMTKSYKVQAEVEKQPFVLNNKKNIKKRNICC